MQQITCYLIPSKLYFRCFHKVTYAFIQNSTPVFNNIASSVSLLITITTYVASLATLIATFGWRPLWTVACYVARLVAVIARTTGSTTEAVWWFWTFTRNVASLVTVVAGWSIRILLAISRDVANTVTAVTPVLLFSAIAGEMPKAITFVALAIPTSASTATAKSSTALGAFSSKMSWAIAFVTHTWTHCRYYLDLTANNTATRTYPLSTTWESEWVAQFPARSARKHCSSTALTACSDNMKNACRKGIVYDDIRSKQAWLVEV